MRLDQAALAELGGLRASDDSQDQALIAVTHAFTAAAGARRLGGQR